MAEPTQMYTEEDLIKLGVDVDAIRLATPDPKVERVSVVESALKEARTDTTPALSIDDEGIIAIGDVNQVTNEPHTYTVNYSGVYPDIMPQQPKDWVADEKGLGSFTVKYTATRVTPYTRKRIERHAMVVQYSYLQLYKERDVVDMSFADLVHHASEIADTTEEAVRKIVTIVLGIPDDLADYIEPLAYSQLYAEVVENNPEFFQ